MPNMDNNDQDPDEQNPGAHAQQNPDDYDYDDDHDDDDYNEDDDDYNDENPLYPVAITGPIHAAVLITTLLHSAQAALVNAAEHQEAQDLYLAAANVECAAVYLHIAEPIIADACIQGEILNVLDHTRNELHALRHTIIEEAEPYPLYEETVARLQITQQAILNLDRTKEIATVLDTQGQHLPDWDQELQEAHISAAQYFAYQPPLCEFDNQEEPLDPRPDLVQKAQTARSEAREMADRIMTDYENELPLLMSPGTAALHDLDTHPCSMPLSPSIPHFGLHPEPNGQQQKQSGTGHQWTAYMIFIHQGTKYVKTINETYPKEFPRSLAEAYADIARRALDMTIQETPGPTTLDHHNLYQKLYHMQDAAELGLHSTTPDEFHNIIRTARDMKLPRGALTRVCISFEDLYAVERGLDRIVGFRPRLARNDEWARSQMLTIGPIPSFRRRPESKGGPGLTGS